MGIPSIKILMGDENKIYTIFKGDKSSKIQNKTIRFNNLMKTLLR